MALFDTTIYVSGAGWSAVTAWAAGAAKVVGDRVRQTAALGTASRVFICIVAGTTHATTEPTWVTTRGGKTTDNTVTWQEATGLAALNGDDTNTQDWNDVANQSISLGVVVKNVAGTHLFICTTAGSAGSSEPTWNTTTGATTVDSGATWTCIGAVGAFASGSGPHAMVFSALGSNWTIGAGTVYVLDTHTESYSGGVTLTAGGSNDQPASVIAHDGGAYPPAASNISDGVVLTNSTSGTFQITGTVHYEGIEFAQNAGSGTMTIPGRITFRNCYLNIVSTNSSATIVLTNFAHLIDTDIAIGRGVSQSLNLASGRLIMEGGTVPFAGSPSVIMTLTSGVQVTMRGVNINISGGAVVANGGAGLAGNLEMYGCKLGGSPALASSNRGENCRFVNVDDGAFSYVNTVFHRKGRALTETGTRMLGDNGAWDGATPFSWEIFTESLTPHLHDPYESPPISNWNSAVGSPVTARIEGVWDDDVVPPTNEKIWVEFEYLGDAASPQSSRISTGLATPVSTPTQYDESDEVWSGGTTAFRMEATFTPQLAGMITARVKIAQKSANIHINPRVIIV